MTKKCMDDGLRVCYVQHHVTSYHTESQISQEQSSTAFSLHWWMTTCVHSKKCITHSHPVNFISSTFVLFSCAPFGAKSYNIKYYKSANQIQAKEKGKKEEKTNQWI